MQDEDRVERALIDYMRAAEAAPTEDGDLEARAASMARAVTGLLASKAGMASVMVLDGMAVVRVRMKSPAGRRTVTAGVDVFSQVFGPALNEMPGKLVPGALEALRSCFPDQAKRMQEEVDRSASEHMSDPAVVKRWKDRMSGAAEKRVKTERDNLVSKMSSLLASGWTHEMLVEAVMAATCRDVMSA